MSQLSAPINIVIDALENSIVISWDAVANGQNYVVERKGVADESFEQIGEVQTTSFTDEGLPNNSLYQYRVKTTAIGYTDSAYIYVNAGTLFVGVTTDLEGLNDKIRFEDVQKFGTFLWGKPEKILASLNDYLPPTVQ